MVRVNRTFTVDRPLAEVVEYLSDFARTEEWDPGTVSCRRLDTGPIVVGSRWHNKSKFLGREAELEYRMERFDPDHLTFTGKNDGSVATDDLGFAARGEQTEITYQANITLTGKIRFIDPLLRLPMKKVADDTVETMKKVLERR